MMANRRINPNLKQKFQQQLQQVKVQNLETMRHRFQKRKVGMLTLCSKKDLHFLLNSLLQGDVFEQDILNQFWQAHFKQTATVGQIIKIYNNAMVQVTQKIIQNNIIVHQITKQRQRHKQDHNFKLLNLVSQQLQQINQQINQYNSDLQELCKPFNIQLSPVISKYKPYRLKEKMSIEEDILTPRDNVFMEFEQTTTKKESNVVEEDQLSSQEKYYRFFIYLTIFVTFADLTLCYSKYNFVDLLANFLLLLNSLFEYYLFRDDHIDDTFQFVSINYDQNRILVNDVMSMPLHLKTLKTATVSQQNMDNHIFQKYTYSSFCLLSVALLFDILWILLLRNSFLQGINSTTPSLLSNIMWKYNHYVVYVSYITAGIKFFMLLILTRTVNFEWKKLATRYNFYLNFIRFASPSYINQLVINVY